MRYLLGVDLGTSSVKAVIIGEAGQVVSEATAEYPLYTPYPGWAEQDPEEWWRGSVEAIRKALSSSGISRADVVGLGLSGQMHGSVFLDAKGQVIRPALLWCDQRTEAECREVESRIGGKENLLRLAQNQALTGFTAPKILWLRNHEPEAFERVRKVLLPKDYIRYRLTGEIATEVSDASGTLLLDIRKRRWSQEMLAALGIDIDLLPRVYESPEVTGTISTAAAELLGLRKGVPVVGGGGDQAAAAVGMGVVKPGIISLVIGTSGVVFACCDKPRADADGRLHSFCHAIPGQWHVMGVTLAAGGSLRWYRDTFCRWEVDAAAAARRDPYEYITEEAARAPVGSEGLVFLPYLAGERTPYPDPNARGVFLGASLRHGKGHFSRAVLEGVAFSLNDCLGLIKGAGIPVQEVRVGGGGARSALWLQILADVFGIDLGTVSSTEGAAYGAALLAGVGAGVYPDVPGACESTVRVSDTITFSRERHEAYREYYALYRSLYPALRGVFEKIASLPPAPSQ